METDGRQNNKTDCFTWVLFATVIYCNNMVLVCKISSNISYGEYGNKSVQ